MNNPIMLAYSLDGDGNGIMLNAQEASEKIKSDDLAWVHLDLEHPETPIWLEKETSYLDPFITSALLAEETRPRMTQIADGILIILRGVNLNENADPEDMVSIRLWIDKHRIISVRKRRLKAVSDIEERLKIGKGPKDSGQFLCMLISSLFERMQPVLSDLDENTDLVEERILHDADTEHRVKIVGIRKQAILFRRYMSPQKDAIAQLRMAECEWFTEAHKRQIQEAHDMITRYVEDLDAIRERAQIVKDELSNLLSEKLNKNLYILSIISAIFLPLGFLTGMFGINVGGMPGAENSNAFWIFSGLLLGLVLIQIYVFKRLKWF